MCLIAKSNENLVKAIPIDVMKQNLTYSQLAGATFGNQSYTTIIDIVIILCQGSNYMLYLKYVGDQVNQIICQETDARFCADSERHILLYYYLPVSVLVLFLS